MTPPRRLLVTGAVGKQGGALISALLAKSSQPLEIYEITRSRSSGKSQQLATKPNVKTPIWGVFSVRILGKAIVIEEAQGKSLTAAAIKAESTHIVLASTDCGRQEKSENNPTVVPHFASDELSPRDAEKIFKEEVGQDIPATYGWLGGSIRWAVADLRHMFAWFKSDGFGVDVPTLKKQYPFMKDFKTWLREESAWKKD